MRLTAYILSPLCFVPLPTRYVGLSHVAAAPAIAVSAVGLSPNNVLGGTSVTLSVMLDANATLGGSVVTLTYSTHSVLASAPKSVTVANGTKLASVTVVTKATAVTTAVAVLATLGTSSAGTILTVRQPQVAALSLSPTTITGGGSATLNVTLDGPAPAGGITPHIIFSPSSLARLPAIPPACLLGPCSCPMGLCPGFPQPQDTTIAADSTHLRLIVHGEPVRDPRTVNITATLGTPQTVSLHLTPPPVTVTFRYGCDHGTTTTSAVGSQKIGVQVSTSSPVSASGAYVGLTSVPGLGLPPTLELAQVGSSATGHYECVPITLPAVSQRVTLTVIARSGSRPYSGTLTVDPLGMSSFSLWPDQAYSGDAIAGSVRLNGVAPSAGVTVQLWSSDQTVANVPPSVTVPSGFVLGTFPFTVVVPASASGNTASAIIKATYAGQTLIDTIMVTRH